MLLPFVFLCAQITHMCFMYLSALKREAKTTFLLFPALLGRFGEKKLDQIMEEGKGEGGVEDKMRRN